MKQQILSKKEMRIVIACSLAMFCCLNILTFGESFFWNSKNKANAPAIGFLSKTENDIRFRGQGSYIWDKAAERESLHIGDSIFSGRNSKFDLNLNEGGRIEVGENSLIRLSEINSQNLADLRAGRFQIRITENTKVAIDGQIVSFHGADSVVEVHFNGKHKPILKVRRGQVKMTLTNGKSLDLQPDHELALESAIAAPQGPQEAAKVELPKEIVYDWHLYDIYRQDGVELIEKTEAPDKVPVRSKLIWSEGSKKSALIEIQNTRELQWHENHQVDAGTLELAEARLGTNFWRVSFDNGRSWSLPESFVVKARFKPHTEPFFSREREEIPFAGQPLSVPLDLHVSEEAIGYVAQASLAADFPPDATKTFWSSQAQPYLAFYKPGRYFYRFRAVLAQQEISDWSKVKEYIVKDISPPPPPVLSRLSRRGPRTRPKTLMNRVAVNEVPQRLPDAVDRGADVGETVARPPLLDETVRKNEKYNHSVVSAQGFLWTLQSSQQYYQSQKAPVVSGIGLHILSWGEHWGAEGSFKSGAVSMNSAGQDTALRDLEARIHYRIRTGFPFALTRELQTSFFTGYEAYRNSGSLYANQYDLIKFGTSFDFPVWENWSAGGELVYGTASDGSSKQEISGNFGYFLNHDWSLGFGYRLDFFTAGSVSSAPAGNLPYREGYTEGYSILNYHF
jgi:hypothetical protein